MGQTWWTAVYSDSLYLQLPRLHHQNRLRNQTRTACDGNCLLLANSLPPTKPAAVTPLILTFRVERIIEISHIQLWLPVRGISETWPGIFETVVVIGGGADCTRTLTRVGPGFRLADLLSHSLEEIEVHVSERTSDLA